MGDQRLLADKVVVVAGASVGASLATARLTAAEEVGELPRE